MTPTRPTFACYIYKTEVNTIVKMRKLFNLQGFQYTKDVISVCVMKRSYVNRFKHRIV